MHVSPISRVSSIPIVLQDSVLTTSVLIDVIMVLKMEPNQEPTVVQYYQVDYSYPEVV